ncbi:hypothetical protein ACFS07_07065 [Undibacterium arcticum]
MAPPRSNRQPPVGLERQIMRLLVTHPVLAADLDQAAIAAFAHFAPDNAEMLQLLVTTSKALGPHANFAALAEQLRQTGSEFDAMIAEIAADTESEPESARLELAGAVRQTKMQKLTAELNELSASGLNVEGAGARMRELMLQQEQLRQEAQAEIARRV